MAFTIIGSDGSESRFDGGRLRDSLLRRGVTAGIAESVVARTEGAVPPGARLSVDRLRAIISDALANVGAGIAAGVAADIRPDGRSDDRIPGGGGRDCAGVIPIGGTVTARGFSAPAVINQPSFFGSEELVREKALSDAREQAFDALSRLAQKQDCRPPCIPITVIEIVLESSSSRGITAAAIAKLIPEAAFLASILEFLPFDAITLYEATARWSVGAGCGRESFDTGGQVAQPGSDVLDGEPGFQVPKRCPTQVIRREDNRSFTREATSRGVSVQDLLIVEARRAAYEAAEEAARKAAKMLVACPGDCPKTDDQVIVGPVEETSSAEPIEPGLLPGTRFRSRATVKLSWWAVVRVCGKR